MTTTETRTADELRARAARYRQESFESFERCDTDGFLSQWALDKLAQEYDTRARLVEAGGRWEFPALFDLDVLHALLGAPWITEKGAFLAIPPAYTEHVGTQLLDLI